MADQQNRMSTSTFIRNFYSDGMSCLNMSFYNTSLSMKFEPFMAKNNYGRSTYDTKNTIATSIGYEAASMFVDLADDIIAGKIQGCDIPIECAPGAALKLHRGVGQDGKPETIISITRNNTTIPFKFNTVQCTAVENGQQVTKIIETGLLAVKKTVEGYLNGINSDRHLDKMTDEYAKIQESNQNNQQYNNSANRNNSNNYGGYKRYNNNNGNNNGYQNNTHQDMSSYQIQN